MKFARYLEDTQIPEWRKKYIDFRGLKKHIGAIRRARASPSILSSGDGGGGGDGAHLRLSPQSQSQQVHVDGTPNASVARRPSVLSARTYGSTGTSPRPSGPVGSVGRERERERETGAVPPMELPLPATSPGAQPALSAIPNPHTNQASIAIAIQSPNGATPTRPIRRSQTSLGAGAVGGEGASGTMKLLPSLRRRTSMRTTRPTYATLSELLESLDPLSRQFFDKLDKEADKIEEFYGAREHAARMRLMVLRDQLNELRGHRKLYHAMHPAAAANPLLALGTQTVTHVLAKLHVLSDGASPSSPSHVPPIPKTAAAPEVVLQTQTHADPDDYSSAKRKLKVALQEFYRGLELLNDYRDLKY